MHETPLALSGNLGDEFEDSKWVEITEMEWCSTESVTYDEEWHDCNCADEAYFDAMDAQSEEDKDDVWHDCEMPPKLPSKKPRLVHRNHILGYPCVLMLLSQVMLSMYTIGMNLAMAGLTWSCFQWQYFLVLIELYEEATRLWRSLWRPPRP